MVYRMRRGKAAAARAPVQQEAHDAAQGFFITGPCPGEIIFEKAAAYLVGKYDGEAGHDDEGQGLPPEFIDGVNQQEGIKRIPGTLVAQDGHQEIAECTGPYGIDFEKNGKVPFF